jgi:hypothetical protein
MRVRECTSGRDATRAASVLGLTLEEFLPQALERGLDAVDYDPEDFRRELAPFTGSCDTNPHRRDRCQVLVPERS